MEYFKENYLTILHEPSLDMIILDWNVKFITDAEYKKATNAALDLILEKRCTRWLGDLTHMGIIPVETQHWTNNVWFPKLFQSPLQYMALVVSKDVFNKAAVNNMLQKANGITFVTKYFTNKQDAMNWLQQQQVQEEVA